MRQENTFSKDRNSKFKKPPIKLSWEDELYKYKNDDHYLRRNCGVNSLDARNILNIYAARKRPRDARR